MTHRLRLTGLLAALLCIATLVSAQTCPTSSALKALTSQVRSTTSSARIAAFADSIDALAPSLCPPPAPPPPPPPPPAPALTFAASCSGLACTLVATPGFSSYAWTWGDGRSETHPSNTVKNTWAKAGTYMVSLTAGVAKASSPLALGTPPPPAPTPQPPPPAPVPVPVPPTGSASCSNEPAGMTWSNARDFNAKIENGWLDRGEGNFSIVQDPTAPVSPPNVGQARYPTTLPSGSGPIALTQTLPKGLRTVYVCGWIKISPNWIATSQVTKILFFDIGAGGTGLGRVYTGVRGTPTMGAEIDFQSMGVHDDKTVQRQISWNGTPNMGKSATITRGQWARWEILLTANTPGLYDGTASWWLNGVLVGQYSAIAYSGPNETGSGNNWINVRWNPTWGGAGISPPADQFMWYDYLRISGKP